MQKILESLPLALGQGDGSSGGIKLKDLQSLCMRVPKWHATWGDPTLGGAALLFRVNVRFLAFLTFFGFLSDWSARARGRLYWIAHKQKSFWWHHLIYSANIFIWSHVPSQDTKEMWQACWPILEHSILYQSEWLINFEWNLKFCCNALGATDLITNHLCLSCSAQLLCHLVTNWKVLW
jgi:hypothetical protein